MIEGNPMDNDLQDLTQSSVIKIAGVFGVPADLFEEVQGSAFRATVLAHDRLSVQVDAALNRYASAFFWLTARPDPVAAHRRRIRHLLGFADDHTAPAWVRRVHEQQVEAFGSGNGRVE